MQSRVCAVWTPAPSPFLPDPACIHTITCRYYCPDGTQMIECPSGHFCPKGSVAPITCRSSAACTTGATREVIYVPLVISLIILAISHVILNKIAPNGVQKHAATAPGLATASLIASVEREQGTSLRFDDLFLSTNGVPRLQGVSGKIRPGCFTGEHLLALAA
jgi:hypothetical protein